MEQKITNKFYNFWVHPIKALKIKSTWEKTIISELQEVDKTHFSFPVQYNVKRFEANLIMIFFISPHCIPLILHVIFTFKSNVLNEKITSP